VMYTFQKFKFETGDSNYCVSSSEGDFMLGSSCSAVSYSFIITILV
jgi:hypothetical protein